MGLYRQIPIGKNLLIYREKSPFLDEQKTSKGDVRDNTSK